MEIIKYCFDNARVGKSKVIVGGGPGGDVSAKVMPPPEGARLKPTEDNLWKLPRTLLPRRYLRGRYRRPPFSNPVPGWATLPKMKPRGGWNKINSSSFKKQTLFCNFFIAISLPLKVNYFNFKKRNIHNFSRAHPSRPARAHARGLLSSRFALFPGEERSFRFALSLPPWLPINGRDPFSPKSGDRTR